MLPVLAGLGLAGLALMGNPPKRKRRKSRSAIAAYNRARDAETEAFLRSPAGEASRRYRNEMIMRRMRGNPLRPSRNGVLGSRRDALLILDWHGGQGSACYRCGSNWLAGKKVPAEAVAECYNELVNALAFASQGEKFNAKDINQLKRLVQRLGRHYHEQSNPHRNAPLTKSQRRSLLGILKSHSKRRRRR